MITERIYEWAHCQPDAPAIISNDHTLSYGDFARAIEAARKFFELQNLPAGGTAVILPNTLEDAWVFVMALRLLGLTTACIQTIEQGEALALMDVACVVVADVNQPVLKLAGTLFESARLIVVPGAIFSNIREGAPPPHPERVGPFGGHILFTSGTTGTYKKLCLRGDQEDRRNAVQASVYPLTRNTTYHVANFALWTGVGSKMPPGVWYAGGCVVMDTRRDAFNNFFRHGVSLSIVTPSMLKEIVVSPALGARYDNCELLIAGGFLPIELAKETVRRVTNQVGIAYGSTELSLAVLVSRHGTDENMYWLAPVPADRIIRIVDEHGNECPAGAKGELWIELMDIDCWSYLDDNDASARMFRNGFFVPGDLAVKRADGHVRILGRTADVLNIAGLKVAVSPLEIEVQRKLQVAEVCLFSGQNDAGQEELVVAIQTDMALPESTLEQLAREFPSFKRVRFEFFKEFPRTSTGMSKVRRSALRKMVFP